MKKFFPPLSFVSFLFMLAGAAWAGSDPCQLNLESPNLSRDCLMKKVQNSLGYQDKPRVKINSSFEPTFSIQMPSGIQSFAFDEVNNGIYVLHIDKIRGRETSFISRIPILGVSQQAVADTSKEQDFIGHQGLGLERLPNKGVRLWTSVRDDPYKAARFKYENGEVSKLQFYTFFSSEYFKMNETIPTVCEDQKHIVVRGRRSGRNMVARVFDLPTLAKNGPGDYSGDFLYEWKIDPSITQEVDGVLQGLQGMACDDRYVYLLAGGSKTSVPKRIHVYTLDGSLVRRRDDITVGLDSALSDHGGYFYEPEGLAFYKPEGSTSSTLHIGIVSGPGHKHVNRLWPVKP